PSYALNLAQLGALCISNLCATKPIISKICNSNDNPYIENSLQGLNKNVYLNKYSIDGGKWYQKLAAVSVYKKTNKNPILITLHTQYWDTPTINGTTYSIDLYQITNKNGKIQVTDISKILGDKQSGLDGVSDDYILFDLKNIALIKKWLDKNYK
ncbi:hypothetical protein ACFPT0_10070, partial [Acinetobacter portensis]|uniref:hypothetical protein n=1 Tax=Acinetobacter portensis TaxID=1839785 RepID=UPI00361E1576